MGEDNPANLSRESRRLLNDGPPDHDAIDEAIYDAVCDGEGRASAEGLLHHLMKRGLTIVKI